MQRIAVIGLGRFGTAVAKRLGASGTEVIAIDRDMATIEEIKSDVDVAVCLDSTDRAALLSQEIDKVDACVISIGEDFESALLTTVLANQIGVKEVICRAQTPFHAEIFRQIGADRVIQPEQETGERLARQLAAPQLVDFISLAEGFSLIELVAPASFVEKTPRQINLRAKYRVNLISIRRRRGEDADDETISMPDPDEPIRPNDILLLVGPDEALSKLPKE